MPWLVPPKRKKDAKEELINQPPGDVENQNHHKKEDPLLFVHVPRCGGTSLTKQFKVLKQAREGRSLWHKFGLTYFQYRYRLLETANFPLLTYENLIVCIQGAIAFMLWYFELIDSKIPYITMFTTATISFLCSTFLFTAPISGRLEFMRKAYAIFVGYILQEFTASYDMLTGVGKKGYIVHWTAAKMVNYGQVSQESFDNIDNFTIVRNPFSRLVSIYNYNKFPCESFDNFVEDWYIKWKRYKNKKSTDEWDVYCHVLPQAEYTHMHGRQLIRNVIKQEDLKKIVKGTKKTCFVNGSSKGVIPDRILQALKEMPHSNRRTRSKPWQDYFSERSMLLALEMYSDDFLFFDYDLTIPGRPDLDYVSSSSDDSSSNGCSSSDVEAVQELDYEEIEEELLTVV